MKRAPIDRPNLHPGWCECRRCHPEAHCGRAHDVATIAAAFVVGLIVVAILYAANNGPAIARALGL